MKEVTAFTCDYCPKKKRFAFRWYAAKHEAKCFYNPARRACATCEHFIPATRDRDRDAWEDCACAEDAFVGSGDSENDTPLRSNCPSWQLKSALASKGEK